MIVVVTKHDQQVEQKLLTMPMNNLARVVQAQKDDVQHQRDVNRPVDAVAIKIETVHDLKEK